MASIAVTGLGVVAIVVLVSLSAFFSSSETAIFTLPDGWEAATERDDRRADTLRSLRSNPHRLLVTVLVGNNVVNVAIASVTTALLIDALPAGIAVSAATVLASVVVLVFGEIVPKSYGLGHAREWALTVAGPIRLVERLLSPLVTAFDRLTRRIGGLIGGEGDVERPYLDE
jgi:Mg2+/Co2+ transporter CorB